MQSVPSDRWVGASYQFSETVLQIQSPEALQILGLAIQNRQSKIQN